MTGVLLMVIAALFLVSAILALIIGGKLAGFIGLIVSVPISAALMEFFNDLEKEKISKRNHSG